VAKYIPSDIPLRTRDIPRPVREAVLTRADGHCERCNEKIRLELHHLTYYREGEGEEAYDRLPIFGYETPDDLLALCRTCHEGQHKEMITEKEYYWWNDPEERAENENDFYNAIEQD
jgi:5-methylcytosine-specific restriction endonuclease McrA